MKDVSTLSTNDMYTLGNKIECLRKQKNICQKELAIYLHVSISTISNYENDVHEPDLPTLVKLADYFDVSTDFLLGRTEYTYPVSSWDTHMIAEYSISSIMNTALELSEPSQVDLVNYLAMLCMRDRMPKPLTLDNGNQN